MTAQKKRTLKMKSNPAPQNSQSEDQKENMDICSTNKKNPTFGELVNWVLDIFTHFNLTAEDGLFCKDLPFGYMKEIVVQCGEKCNQVLTAVQQIILKRNQIEMSYYVTQKRKENRLMLEEINIENCSPQEIHFWNTFFHNLGITAQDFMKQYFYPWILMSHPKKNTIWFTGPPSSGKTFFVNQLLYPFKKHVARISNQGLLNDFAMAHIIKYSILLWEEPLCDLSIAQDMKNILGGQIQMTNVKFISDRQKIPRKPVIITSNYTDLQRGVMMSSLETQALNERCMYIYFSPCFPKCDELLSDDSLWRYLNKSI